MDQQQTEQGAAANACLPQTITILLDGVFDFVDYLDYHVTNYNKLYPHITVQLNRVGGDFTALQEELIASASSPSPSTNSTWDGSIFPVQIMGALVEANALWDWTDYIDEAPADKSSPTSGSENSSSSSSSDNHAHNSLLQWPDVLPFFRNEVAVYDTQVKVLPLDGDLLLMYYRKDLLEEHGLNVPRTWDEYTQVAKYFHNKALGPNGTPLYGSCISRVKQCGNPYWTSLLLSSLTQTMGTSSGFLLDPTAPDTTTTTRSSGSSSSSSSSSSATTANDGADNKIEKETSDWNFFLRSKDEVDWDPILLGQAMEETLRYTTEQVQYGHPEELSGSCLAANYAFNEGQCALTVNWGNQLAGLLNEGQNGTFEVGVAPTPGSRRILDRRSRTLVDCTTTNCPHGILYSDLGLVNVAPYAAFGGWAAGVNSKIAPSTQRAMAHFFSYLSNPAQSVQDVLPHERSTFAQPYRYSQLQSSLWMDGIDSSLSSGKMGLITDFARATRDGFVDSQNTVLEVRISEGQGIREIIDDEIHLFLSASEKFGRNLTQAHRSNATLQMTERIRKVLKLDEQDEILRNRAQQANDNANSLDGKNIPILVQNYTLLERYQQSLHVFPEPANQYYIESSLRMAGWGLGGMICGGALLVLFWTLWYRRHRVIIAAQSNILIQSSVGIFFLGLTIPLLSLDESLGLNKEVLDYTCMVIPWCYTLGFTILFSAVYAKIRQCKKVYSDPHRHHNVLLVPPRSAVKLCFRLLMLNGAILFIWNTVDPLLWYREEMPGTSSSSSLWDREGDTGRARIALPDTYGTCRGEGNGYIGFATLLFVVNQTMLVFAILQAFKCRFLTVEFNEMQWLPLALVPLVEAWTVGAPILFLVQAYPTGIFIVLTMVIGFSSVSAMLAIFAPKEWYIRKDYHDMEKKKVRHGPHPSGVVVLSHPDVSQVMSMASFADFLHGESLQRSTHLSCLVPCSNSLKQVADAREIERLQFMLDSFDSSNIELEQEICAINVKLAEAEKPEVKVAASVNLQGIQGELARPRPGSTRAEIEHSMSSTIKEKCDEILSMADEDFSDSEWSDEPDEKAENEENTDVLMEGMNNPEFTERSNSEQGPGSWKAPSVSENSASEREHSEHGPDSWRAPWATDSSEHSGPGPDSWRAPSVHGPDSWKMHKTSNDDDSYGYGLDTADVGVNSLVATPNSSLAVYEDSNSREVSRSSEHDLESGAGTRSRLHSTPERISHLPSSSSSQSVSVFEDSPAREAPPSPYSPSRRGYSEPRPEQSPGSFSMFEGDAPSSVGAASTSVGMSTTLSLSLDEDSNSGSTALGPSPPTSIGDSTAPHSTKMKILKHAQSPSRTLDTQRSPSTSTAGTKEEVGLSPGVVAGTKRGQEDDLSCTSSGSDDSGKLIRKKEYSVLDSALDTDDLEAIELNASRLAESLKSRLNDTMLSDYGDDTTVKEDLSVKICASFDTDAGESMADMILNTLLEPSLFDNLTGVSRDGQRIQDARALNSSIGGSSSGSDGGGVLFAENTGLSAGEASSAEDVFRDTPTSSNGLIRGWDTRFNGEHTQKAGEPSRGDYLRDDQGGLSREGASFSRNKLETGRQEDFEVAGPRRVIDSKGYSPKKSPVPAATKQEGDVKDGRFPMNGIFNMGMEGANLPATSASNPSWTPPDDLDLHVTGEGKNLSSLERHQKQLQEQRHLHEQNIPWSPPDELTSSFEVGDWAAVGTMASILADDTDSQSTSSRATDSVSESISSIDATQSASALDTPMANHLDKLVGQQDWDGIKNAAVKYETKPNRSNLNNSHETPPQLEEKRRRKREIEAWRSSISQSFTRSPD
jgi:ABC-type glycerol-3-phosphate transport system substrate-binding protein